MTERDMTSVPRAAIRVVDRLIHHAARRAPASLAERLEEEWSADAATRPSTLSRLRFALGCCWATRVIAYEHRVASVALTGSTVGAKLLFAHLHHDRKFLLRRSTTLFLVIGLHAALFYALMTGLAFNIIKELPSPLQTRLVPQSHPRELPPPLPEPQWRIAKLEVPIPEFTPPADPNDDAARLRQPPSDPPQPPPLPHVVNRVPGGPGSGFPNLDDYYPSAAKRMEEQGIATVRVCVDPDGRLTADPTTVQTSGSARLDEGALQLAKAGSGHYRATTEDGRPVNSCYAFRIRFELRN